MIKIKLLTALTAQNTSAILAYANGAELVDSEIVADLSAAVVIRRICPKATFSVLAGDPENCIIHSKITVKRLLKKLGGSPATSIGPALFSAESLSMPLVEKLLNDSTIIDIHANSTAITLMALTADEQLLNDMAAIISSRQNDPVVAPISFPSSTSVVKPGTDIHVDLASLTAVTTSAVDLDYWALPRMFSRTSPHSTTINRFNPIHPVLTNIYLMDSGVNSSHSEFNNNVQDLYTITPGIFADNVGHGTQLASAMIGKTVGVAPEFVNVKNVKIFDAVKPTTLENLIQAFQAIADDVAANPGNHVVNMSWVISKNTVIEHLIQSLMDNYGIKFVCAAGNSGQPIELLTPAAMDSVITVGAIDNSDIICGFTNYVTDPLDPSLPLFKETSVDVFAPGFKCKVADYTGVNALTKTTGTSVASAYVAAVAAYTSLLLYPKIATQADLYTAVVEYSTKELILMTDPKYALMPNRIVWCLNDCQETKMPKITTIGHRSQWEKPTPDLNKLPEENAAALAIYNAILAHRNTTFNDTNFSQYGSDFLAANRSFLGVVLSEPLTPDSVLKPIVSYAINNNYFSQFELEHVLIEADPLDISLQYKTTGTGTDCGANGCYYATCILTNCVLIRQDTPYSWTNSIANGYIKTYTGTCGALCDFLDCPGCCYPACV